MEIIDKAGRIFGKINLIDLSIVLLFIALGTGLLHLISTGDLFRDFDPTFREFVEKDIFAIVENPLANDVSLFKSFIGMQDEKAHFLLLNTTFFIERSSILFHFRLKTRIDQESKQHVYFDGTNTSVLLIPGENFTVGYGEPWNISVRIVNVTKEGILHE